MANTDTTTIITTAPASTSSVVPLNITAQTTQGQNSDSNSTATTVGEFPTANPTDGSSSNTGEFSTTADSTNAGDVPGNSTGNSNTTTDTGSTSDQTVVIVVVVSIILLFMLCTGFCLFLLSDWSCTQPKAAAGKRRGCSCSCLRCFSRQDFRDTSAFSPSKSESHEALEMDMTRVTEVGSYNNTSTLHWSTGNQHSFHRTGDPGIRRNPLRGVIEMLPDASRSKKYSEAINLDIFQQGEDETGRDSPTGDEVSETSNHTMVTEVSIHTHEHNERSSQRSSNSDQAAGGGQQELAAEQTVPKRSQGRKRGVYMSESDVSDDSKNRSYSQSVAEAMRTFDSTALAQYHEEEEQKDQMMTTEL
ncbi:uncharacterized protein LOC118426422 isoform X2 [Branchiostoma floridae]|uniref:Uncharacterized protein LOC118426422 isoform X2 n=1 Tax=Branchiostoma floridae TaxID=7739 RepID=A0A9J7N6I2_BRAFL|nr:uncharacterized protein LOC118426422 isoform X2 [Branchiostoma floridae]